MSLKEKKKLEEIIIDVPEGIKIIAGASGFHQLANLDVKQREYFIKSLAELNADDYMIIDTGAGISQNVLSFLVASDEVIVITTPEPTSITDAYGTIKAIAANDPDKTVKLLVNRAQTVTEAKKVAQRVINIAGQFLNIKVDNLGFIFDDLYVAKSIRNQKPFIVSYPKSKASTCVEIIADRIGNIESDIDKGTGMLSFFRRFFGHYEMDNDDGVV